MGNTIRVGLLVVVLGACGGGGGEGTPDGSMPGDGSNLPDGGSPDANITMGDDTLITLTTIVATADDGVTTYDCKDAMTSAKECKANEAGVFETRHPKIKFSGMAALSAGGFTGVSVKMNDLPVEINAGGQWTFTYEPPVNCNGPNTQVALNFTSQTAATVTPAKIVIDVVYDGCAPKLTWPAGVAGDTFAAVDDETKWTANYVGAEKVPCVVRSTTPAAGDVVAMNPAVTPTVVKYSANVTGEPFNDRLRGGNGSAADVGECATAPPAGFELASSNDVRYRFRLTDDHTRDLTLTARVIAPGGAEYVGMATIPINLENRVDGREVVLSVTSAAKPAAAGTINVVVPGMESKPGEYAVSFEVTDFFEHKTTVDAVKWNLSLRPGPLAVPQYVNNGAGGSVLALSSSSLSGGSLFGSLASSSSRIGVAQYAIHNRTPIPLVASVAEIDPRIWTEQKLYKVVSKQVNGFQWGSCGGSSAIPTTWVGFIADWYSSNTHSVYTSTSTSCLDGASCRVVTVPAYGTTYVVVSMNGMSELLDGQGIDRNTLAYPDSLPVFAKIDSTVQTSCTNVAAHWVLGTADCDLGGGCGDHQTCMYRSTIDKYQCWEEASSQPKYHDRLIGLQWLKAYTAGELSWKIGPSQSSLGSEWTRSSLYTVLYQEMTDDNPYTN